MELVEYTTGGGVVVYKGRMLLLERPQRGEIRLPKGHIDPGETPEQAALREVAEETGYSDLKVVGNLGMQEVEFDYQGRRYRRCEHYFAMRLCSEHRIDRSPEDEAQFRVWWAPLDRAPNLLTFPAEQRMARAALAFFENTE